MSKKINFHLEKSECHPYILTNAVEIQTVWQ